MPSEQTNCNSIGSPQDYSSLVDVLQARARHQPDKTAYVFLHDGENESARLTYGELDRQARAIAGRLQSLGATGSRALQLQPSGPEFVAAFLGCLYAGVVAVPIHPPQRSKNFSRLKAIVANAGAEFALTTGYQLADLRKQFANDPNCSALQWLATDEIAADEAFAWNDGAVSPDAVAFLQYTSGSTGTPRGVRVSHSNLLNNQRMIESAFGHSQKTIVVGWLPLQHDMGLIGNVLHPLYIGVPCILMPPTAFLQRPVRWLQAISRYKATTSGGPNFAYDLCTRKITLDQRATLDLGSWEIAFNGAEPVRSATLVRFAATFGPCGFRREAFYPCYGMAEATLIISGGVKTASPVEFTVNGAALEQNRIVASSGKSDERTLVGCGRALLGQKVVIVDPESCTQCPPDRVGEIWVSGPSMARGYWNRCRETDRTFNAFLADTWEGPFLRTRDLGFLRDGELFVTGRLDDLIIIYGRNHYPQDIERTVEQSHPGLRAGCGAAFSVEIRGDARLFVVQEVERSYLRKLDVDDVVGNIREAVAQSHGLQIHTVTLVKTGAIPKTPSGKVRRHACRREFEATHFAVLGGWSKDPDTASLIRVQAAKSGFGVGPIAAGGTSFTREIAG